jgi:hypothetical protein
VRFPERVSRSESSKAVSSILYIDKKLTQHISRDTSGEWWRMYTDPEESAEHAKRLDIEQDSPNARVEPYIQQTRATQVSSSSSPLGCTCICNCGATGNIGITEDKRPSKGMKAKAKTESRYEEDLVPDALSFEYVQAHSLSRSDIRNADQ